MDYLQLLDIFGDLLTKKNFSKQETSLTTSSARWLRLDKLSSKERVGRGRALRAVETTKLAAYVLGSRVVHWCCWVEMPTTRRTTAEDLTFGVITPPVYNNPFSINSSCIFFKEYRKYERDIKLRNSEQSVRRPLVTFSQLLPDSIYMLVLGAHLFQRAAS